MHVYRSGNMDSGDVSTVMARQRELDYGYQSGRSPSHFLITLLMICSGLVTKSMLSRADFLISALWHIKILTTRSFDNTLGWSDDWCKTLVNMPCRIKTRLMMYVARNFTVKGLIHEKHR